MALPLPPDHVRALDQLRTRLSQLSTSLVSLQQTINTSREPLPSWPVLQADASILGANLHELAAVLNEQRQLFTSMHAYPLPVFPGPAQEVILQSLLRKKLNPGAATWLEESGTSGEAVHAVENTSSSAMPIDQVEELWTWAKPASREFLAPLLENGDMESDYTLKEQELGIENVVTGVRSLDEGDEDEDKMTDDDSHAVQRPDTDSVLPVVPLETLLQFASGRRIALSDSKTK